jgi:peptidoglycan/xylan/chitin deacetylase (PgdA/CDA1 family)
LPGDVFGKPAGKPPHPAGNASTPGQSDSVAAAVPVPAGTDKTVSPSSDKPEKPDKPDSGKVTQGASGSAPSAAPAAGSALPLRPSLAKPATGSADDITQKLVANKLPPVYLYQSASTRSFLAAGGVNYQNNIDTWQLLLKRLDIPFELLDQVERLNVSGTERGLVVLPSAVALSETERRTLARFHERGGAMLATWLCGVRNEQGQWLGFNFMETVLDTKVSGTTEPDNDDVFLIPHGDNPISHQLPSGLRVWTERVANWYPLRLSGSNLAARITDWSRSTTPDKRNGLVSFNQRQAQAGGARSVVLGYPERLWFSADPKAFDAIAGDALFWLLRQPAVYPATWPHPYRSAFVLAVGAADFTEQADLAFAKQTEAAGWKGTYYVLTERADESREILKKIQQAGHEIGYFGDRLVGFQNQSANQQKKRVDTMLSELRDAEVEPASPPGFKAPLDAFDATTIRLLRGKGFGHIIADQGASETRLPQWASGNGEALALLPRTLSAPEDLMTDNTPANAIHAFNHEIDEADTMGALGVVSVPSHSSLSGEQWGDILSHLKQRGPQLWLASANQVVNWWREHERVKVSLNADVVPALLTIEVAGDAPLQQPFSLLVNLPRPASVPRLIADGHALPAPKTESFDALRGALIFANLPPGTWHWYLSFPTP